MVKDSKGRKVPGYDLHVFICSHERAEDALRPCCAKKDSLRLMKNMKAAAKEQGIHNIRIQKSGCLDFCENGISCVVYPEGLWYTLTGDENIPVLLEHLQTGTVAEQLLMNLED
ncbi:MAG: (2Fe-2S) ferredoxin domain-containing protein [Candidatus Thermoplasmatota archaeon]|nr:(2Fe-2S) ferredoxin domain-containing protein [Candidatus Thermoplasmatota archaeon]